MNFEQRERFEQLKKANKERQRQKEIGRNVLLLECIEALGTEGEVLEQKQKNIVYCNFKNNIPFLPGGIDWKQFDLFNNINQIEDIFEMCRCKKFYIIWGDGLPIMMCDIVTIMRHIDDVCAVEFDTWLLSVDNKEIIEFHHDLGNTYGRLHER